MANNNIVCCNCQQKEHKETHEGLHWGPNASFDLRDAKIIGIINEKAIEVNRTWTKASLTARQYKRPYINKHKLQIYILMEKSLESSERIDFWGKGR